MSKHVFKTKKLTIDGKKIRQVVVSMGKSSKKTILVLDNFFGLDEETPQNTFANLCYEVCSTLKSGHTFVYSETTGLDGTGVRNLIEKVEPDGIMFASSVPFNRVGLDTLQYFQHVRKFDGVPAILTTPFSKWTGSGGFEKGEAGKNLIGFNLKDLLAVTEGKNPYTPITKDDLKYPIRFIKTREQFDKFIEKMESKKLVCIDTEAANLNKIVNTVFTIQFGFRTKKGIETYILPWKHKDFTWDKSDFIHVKKTLKSYFMKTKAELLFHFAPYDVGQLCVILDLPFFPADTYDTVAGNFAMDENHKYLDNMFNIDGNKYSPYSLSHIEAKFGIFRPDDILGKDDRKNMSRFTLEEVGTYGAFDVVSPILIRERQIEMATSKYIGYKSVDAYKKLVIHQLGIMVKTFAFLHNTGIHIDQDNANKLVKKDSVFNTVIEKIKKDLLATKNGKRANEILLKKQGMTSAGGMFSSTKAEIFSLTKPAHLRTLFFDVMKLKPIRTGKNGDPSTDKAFQKAYKHLEEVKLFGQFNKVKTLKSNFADSIIKLAKSDPDFINDGRLRPFFGFVKVLPGRISVNRPNSQNVPTRSDKDFELHKDLVKSIKGNFSVTFGRIMLGSDFSAHEVRVSGIIAQDPEIGNVFRKANEAIRKYRLTPLNLIEKAAEVLAREGDIHIQNVRFFFQKDVDKKHVLRDQIKAIVFGVLYGKMAKALARELGITVDEAQSLIDVMFEKWSNLKSWIDNVHETGKATCMIHYPNNRIRHLWAYLHDDIWVHHAMDRRGVNSPVQGFASDIGIASVYCYKDWVYRNITRKGKILDSKHVNIVHDAQYSDNLYEHMPFCVYLTEHSMSTLPMNYFKKKFDYELSIPLSYGMEFGRKWSALNEWNFRPEVLLDMFRDEGKNLEKSGKQIDKVIEDTKYMLKIRNKELERDPYTMLVNSNTIDRVFTDLNMFNMEIKHDLLI